MPISPFITPGDLIALLAKLPEGALVTALTRANTGNLAVMVDNKDWGYIDLRLGAVFEFSPPTLH